MTETRNVKMSLQLTRDRILVRRKTARELPSGLVLPEKEAEQDPVPIGEIVAVGPGVDRTPEGDLIPLGTQVTSVDENGKITLTEYEFRPGDQVYFLKSGAVRMRIKREEFFLLHAPSIIGLVDVEESPIVVASA